MAEEKFALRTEYNEIVLYLATHRHQPQTFDFLISKVNKEYFELAVKEYDLAVEKAIQYI